MDEADLFAFVKRIYADLEASTNEFSFFDCISNAHRLYIELKCRRTHYDSLLVEKVKFDRLRNLSASMGFKPIYICSTPMGIWGFNLDKIAPVWEKSLMPKTTNFFDIEKVEKVVGYLKLDQGIKLK